MVVVIYKNQCARERHHATELRGVFFFWGEWGESEGEKEEGRLASGYRSSIRGERRDRERKTELGLLLH